MSSFNARWLILRPDLPGTAECTGLLMADSWNMEEVLFETVNMFVP